MSTALEAPPLLFPVLPARSRRPSLPEQWTCPGRGSRLIAGAWKSAGTIHSKRPGPHCWVFAASVAILAAMATCSSRSGTTPLKSSNSIAEAPKASSCRASYDAPTSNGSGATRRRAATPLIEAHGSPTAVASAPAPSSEGRALGVRRRCRRPFRLGGPSTPRRATPPRPLTRRPGRRGRTPPARRRRRLRRARGGVRDRRGRHARRGLQRVARRADLAAWRPPGRGGAGRRP